MFDIPLTMVTSVLPVALIAVGPAYGIHVLENVFSDAEEGKAGLSGIITAATRVSLPVISRLTTIASVHIPVHFRHRPWSAVRRPVELRAPRRAHEYR